MPSLGLHLSMMGRNMRKMSIRLMKRKMEEIEISIRRGTNGGRGSCTQALRGDISFRSFGFGPCRRPSYQQGVLQPPGLIRWIPASHTLAINCLHELLFGDNGAKTKRSGSLQEGWRDNGEAKQACEFGGQSPKVGTLGPRDLVNTNSSSSQVPNGRTF